MAIALIPQMWTLHSMYTQNKARFSHLLRHLAWKRRGPILVSALHWSLAYLDTYHLVTAPGPTRGTYTRKEPLEGTGFLQAGCPSCNQPTMPIHCRKPEALTPVNHWTPDGRGVGPFMPALQCHTTLWKAAKCSLVHTHTHIPVWCPCPVQKVPFAVFLNLCCKLWTTCNYFFKIKTSQHTEMRLPQITDVFW